MAEPISQTYELQIDGRQLFHPVYLTISGSGQINEPTNPEVVWGWVTPPPAKPGDPPPPPEFEVLKGVDTRLQVVTYTFGPDPNGIMNTDGSNTLRIAPPGIYQVWSGDAVRSSVLFEFKADGTFVLVDSNEAALGDSQGYYSLTPATQGQPAKLLLIGFPIDIDARYLTGTGMIVSNNPSFCLESGSPNQMAFTFHGNFLPSEIGYCFEQGSSMTNQGIGFTVDTNGNVFYKYPADDFSAGGPYRGYGTKAIELLGYPVIIDARAVGPNAIVDVLNLPGPYDNAGDPAVALLCLMPLPVFGLSFGPDDPPATVTAPTFGISPLEQGPPEKPTGISWQITVSNGISFALSKDFYRGVPRITVTRRE